MPTSFAPNLSPPATGFVDHKTIASGAGVSMALGINNNVHRAQASGNITVAISGWPVPGTLGELLIVAVNFGLGTPTFPAGNWIKSSDGSFAATPALASVTFQSGGTDFILSWTLDGGVTVYYKVMR